MWATLVSKVGLCCELPVLVGCWAVVGLSSVVTGGPFPGGDGGAVAAIPIPRQLRLILQILSADGAAT
jgi:hypothetical protein